MHPVDDIKKYYEDRIKENETWRDVQIALDDIEKWMETQYKDRQVPVEVAKSISMWGSTSTGSLYDLADRIREVRKDVKPGQGWQPEDIIRVLL